MKVHLVLGLSVLMLCGCTSKSLNALKAMKAGLGNYRLPAGTQQIAQVRIISSGSVRGIPNSDCVDWDKPGSGAMEHKHRPGLKTLNFASLGIPINTTSDQLRRQEGFSANELKIPAGKPFVFSFEDSESGEVVNSRYTVYSCNQAISFTPEAGKNYQLFFVQATKLKKCLATLSVLDANGDPALEPVHLEKAPLCQP